VGLSVTSAAYRAAACGVYSPQVYGCDAGTLLRAAVETQRTSSWDGALTTVQYCGGAVYACHASGSLGLTCSGATATCVFSAGAAPPRLDVNETRTVVEVTRSSSWGGAWSRPPNVCWTTPRELNDADRAAGRVWALGRFSFAAALLAAMTFLCFFIAFDEARRRGSA
jgi:hypothetical protein